MPVGLKVDQFSAMGTQHTILICTVVSCMSAAPNGHLLQPRHSAQQSQVVKMSMTKSSQSGAQGNQEYPFQNKSLSWHERVDDLVKRLTLEEIATQTIAIYSHPTPGVPRLGIKPYVWQTECLRGLRRTNGTAFPQSIGLAAAWSPDLIFNISEATSFEARAFWNENVKRGQYKIFNGLSCFSPVINIMRDPRWGRNQETYGEDPFLSGTYAQHFVHGLQGSHPRFVRANAGCKHFDVHGGPENIPSSRFSFDAKVAEKDWRMTFLPQFRMCVEAGSLSLMCSYNRINGVPACANAKLMNDITRKEWGFNGYIVSDEGAISNMYLKHNYTKGPTETAAAAINAGCNLELGTTDYSKQGEALKRGLVTEQKLRDNVKPLFYTRMRLGEFDPIEDNPYHKIDISEIESRKHQDLAERAAQMSFVLLKNQKKTLPLRGLPLNKVAIVGPMADNADQMFGDYAADPNSRYVTTPLHGLMALGKDVSHHAGCTDADPTKCKTYNRNGIRKAVTGAKLVIVCLGLGQRIESEGNDRRTLHLPGHQLELLKDAARFSEGAPVVVLLFNAGPLDMSWAQSSPDVSAILACFYPAQATGKALFKTLTAEGLYGVPGGRLPATWPASLDQVPPMEDYTMENRTYRYFNAKPLYPFGYGLSYTSFKYSDLQVKPTSVKAAGNITVSVTVSNQGDYGASEVAQVYVAWVNPKVGVPKLQLVAFERKYIPSGGSISLRLTVMTKTLQVWTKSGFQILPGEMTVYVGGQQPNQKMAVDSNVLKSSFIVQ